MSKNKDDLKIPVSPSSNCLWVETSGKGDEPYRSGAPGIARRVNENSCVRVIPAGQEAEMDSPPRNTKQRSASEKWSDNSSDRNYNR